MLVVSRCSVPEPRPPRPRQSRSSSSDGQVTPERAERAAARDPRRMGAAAAARPSSTASACRAAGHARAAGRSGAPGARRPAAQRRAATWSRRATRRSTGASTFDRILILPTSTRPAERRSRSAAAAAAAALQVAASPTIRTTDEPPPDRCRAARTAVRQRGCRATSISRRNGVSPPVAPDRRRSRRAGRSSRRRRRRQSVRRRAGTPRPGVVTPGPRRHPADPPAIPAGSTLSAREPPTTPYISARAALPHAASRCVFMSEIDRFRPDDRRGVDTLYRRTHGADAAEADSPPLGLAASPQSLQPDRAARHLGRARRSDRRRPLSRRCRSASR